MPEFKLIVTGGKDYSNYDYLSRVIFAMADVELADKNITIVSSVATGVNALAKQFSGDNYIPMYKFPAAIERCTNKTQSVWNIQMGDFADGLLAFWDGRCKDTAHMITYMKKLGKFVHIVYY
jgi:hypothetical protein